MEDRFKFRYFNKESKRMYYGQGFHIKKLQDDPVNIIFWDNEEHSHLQWKPAVIIMQSTGLKDKNGKLIYEGDIIRINTQGNTLINQGIIYWCNERAMFLRTANLKKNNEFDEYGYSLNNTSIEVIGNIYENSDLLSEVEE